MPTLHYIDAPPSSGQPPKRHWYAWEKEHKQAMGEFARTLTDDEISDMRFDAVWVPNFTKEAVAELLNKHACYPGEEVTP